jgi:uncharacterized membrane protein
MGDTAKLSVAIILIIFIIYIIVIFSIQWTCPVFGDIFTAIILITILALFVYYDINKTFNTVLIVLVVSLTLLFVLQDIYRGKHLGKA